MVNFDDLKEDSPPVSQGQKPGPSFDDLQDDSAKFGSTSEMAKTALEQGLSGATGGLSKVLETQGIPALGIAPITTSENIEGRARANPITAFTSNAVGTTGTIAATGGLGGILEGGSAAARIGTAALEGAGIGGINQATDDWSKNKALDAQRIAGSAGLGALIGGLGGGVVEGVRYKLGTPLAKSADPVIREESVPPPGLERPVISQADAIPYQGGNFQATIENSPAIPEKDIPNILQGLRQQKENAADIIRSAQDIGAPVLEGMTSDSSYIQRAEDSLLNGVPTFSGVQRKNAYQQVYDAVKTATDDAIGEGSPYTKAELGNAFKNSISQKISDQVAPINDLYNELKNSYEAIPLSERSAPALARSIGNLQEFKIAPSSPEGQLANRVIREISNLKTVDDVKLYKSILNRSISPTASSGEKRMAGILSDKLSDLEENSIVRFAENQMQTPLAKDRILGLLKQRSQADAAYKPFRQNLDTLLEQLGKGKVYGAQDAINYIQNNVTPEEVVNKLFSKKDSDFLKFFSDKFPQEMQLMREYQKGVLRDAAQKTGEFTPTTVFREINKLQPEIQQAIFSPKELQKLQSAQVVRQSIPKAFNPSGTAHTTAFRAFFEHPTGALIANARDLAISQFIKSGGGNVGRTTNQALQRHAVNFDKRMDIGIRGLFNSNKRSDQ